jgi:hypothetical protein
MKTEDKIRVKETIEQFYKINGGTGSIWDYISLMKIPPQLNSHEKLHELILKIGLDNSAKLIAENGEMFERVALERTGKKSIFDLTLEEKVELVSTYILSNIYNTYVRKTYSNN